jgi:hypothetical protein
MVRTAETTKPKRVYHHVTTTGTLLSIAPSENKADEFICLFSIDADDAQQWKSEHDLVDSKEQSYVTCWFDKELEQWMVKGKAKAKSAHAWEEKGFIAKPMKLRGAISPYEFEVDGDKKKGWSFYVNALLKVPVVKSKDDSLIVKIKKEKKRSKEEIADELNSLESDAVHGVFAVFAGNEQAQRSVEHASKDQLRQAKRTKPTLVE